MTAFFRFSICFAWVWGISFSAAFLRSPIGAGGVINIISTSTSLIVTASAATSLNDDHDQKPVSPEMSYASTTKKASLSAVSSSSAFIRSTLSTASALVLASLKSAGGFSGLGALTAISSLFLLPMTQIRPLYGVTVGYGLSVGVVGMVLRRLFDPLKESMGHTLSGCTVFYGLRLAVYLLLRDVTGWKPDTSLKRQAPSRLSRIPFAISLGVFYACLTAPVLLLLRSPLSKLATASSATIAMDMMMTMWTETSWMWKLGWCGTILAWMGAILEAVADSHKFLVKNQYTVDIPDFVGPTRGVYGLTRHPNYTGEVMHWFGTYLAGCAGVASTFMEANSTPISRRGQAVLWVASTMGLYGIVSIMRSSTQSLERRQQEKYGGQTDYEEWTNRVRAPLFPFILKS